MDSLTAHNNLLICPLAASYKINYYSFWIDIDDSSIIIFDAPGTLSRRTRLIVMHSTLPITLEPGTLEAFDELS